MITIKINNKELNVSKDLTILQAANLIKIQIPRFCFHEKLSIAGNCRMCLVEVVNVNKPVASCALPVTENMQIFTNSGLVKKARVGVLELLLINHPLDCPVCDQGGECDLQDQTISFGNDRSRFYENKRAVFDKTISTFIKTIMTRCIHCTKCIRFLAEVAGVNQLGITGRGSSSEIGTYIENSIFSELSGNIIDLCPVGALTSKPYTFTARPWEIHSVSSLDINDALGSNIRIDSRGNQILRILPRINEEVNEEWITDKIRFSFDGLKTQRLTKPLYVYKHEFIYKFKNYVVKENWRNFFSCNWNVAFELLYENIILRNVAEFNNTYIILGNSVNVETILLARELFLIVDFNGILHQYDSFFNVNLNNINTFDLPSDYLLNIEPKFINNVDVCLLIGVNLRLENPLLNTRLRKAFLNNNTNIGLIGPSIDSIYKVNKLGNSFKTLKSILEGKHYFSLALKLAKNPLILFNNNFIFLNNIKNIINNFNMINNNLKIGNISTFISDLHIKHIIGNTNLYSTDWFPNKNLMYYLIDADELEIPHHPNNFNVYQGSIADRSLWHSDLILPSYLYIEEESSFYDINGKFSETQISVRGNEFSRTSWKILLAFLHFLQNKAEDLPLIDISELITQYRLNISLQNLNFVKNKKKTIYNLNSITLPNIPLNNQINNYYMTNSITRNSNIMINASKDYNIKINLNFMHS